MGWGRPLLMVLLKSPGRLHQPLGRLLGLLGRVLVLQPPGCLVKSLSRPQKSPHRLWKSPSRSLMSPRRLLKSSSQIRLLLGQPCDAPDSTIH